MAASNEWQVLHLTNEGWLGGGHHLDCGDRKNDVIPSGTVLSVRRHVTVGKLGAPSSMNVDESETKHTNDQSLIDALIKQYGKPQFGV
jgi:hypothetical protein